MGSSLYALFASVISIPRDELGIPIYAVAPIADHHSSFIGKDSEGCACLLVVSSTHDRHRPPAIRLETLEVQFDVLCYLHGENGVVYEDRFTVLRCRTTDIEIVRYFLSVCEVLLDVLGEDPTQHAVAAAVDRLAAMFQKMSKPPMRSVVGLFGELCVMLFCRNPAAALLAWRNDDMARYDFARDELRIEAKATLGRIRIHTFSFDQCNPPPGILAFAASLFVEHTPAGTTLSELVDRLEARVSHVPDLAFKLRDTVAATLGTSLQESMSLSFDLRLAATSLLFYRLGDIPAIREPIPAGVSGIRFQSDLTMVQPQVISVLAAQFPGVSDFLP